MARTSIHILERHPVITFDADGKHAYLHIRDEASPNETAALTLSVAGPHDRDIFADPLDIAAQLEVAATRLREYAARNATRALLDQPVTFAEGKGVWIEPELREAWGK